MSWSLFGPYLLIAVGLVVVPGPDTFLVLRSAMVGGRRAGLLSLAGISAGSAIQGSVSALGLGVLIVQSHTVFLVLRWAGAAYLCVLGIQALRTAARGCYPDVTGTRGVPAHRALLSGFLCNVTNPKVLIMYLSVLPQFLQPGAGPVDGLLLAMVVPAMGTCWMLGLVLAVHRASAWFARRRVRRTGDAMAGAVFLGFGGTLAAT